MNRDLQSLRLALSWKAFSGPEIAKMRDEYAQVDPLAYRDHIDACLESLAERNNCWDCGNPAFKTVDGFPMCPQHPVFVTAEGTQH